MTMNPWEESALEYNFTEGDTQASTSWQQGSGSSDPIIYPGVYAPSGFDILSILVRDIALLALPTSPPCHTHRRSSALRHGRTRKLPSVRSTPRVLSSSATWDSPTAPSFTPQTHSTN